MAPVRIYDDVFVLRSGTDVGAKLGPRRRLAFWGVDRDLTYVPTATVQPNSNATWLIVNVILILEHYRLFLKRRSVCAPSNVEPT